MVERHLRNGRHIANPPHGPVISMEINTHQEVASAFMRSADEVISCQPYQADEDSYRRADVSNIGSDTREVLQPASSLPLERFYEKRSDFVLDICS